MLGAFSVLLRIVASADESIDNAVVFLNDALDEREINSAAGFVFDLLRKRNVRRVVFSHDEQTRGVLVDTVDDSRADYAVNSAERIEGIQKGVDT